MDMIRRNTDYAIRAMSLLAVSHGDAPVSAATIAAEQDISYPLVSKLLQRLQEARLVASSMGVRGGFRLSRDPRRITLLEVVEAIQGKVSLNRCLVSTKACTRWRVCPARRRLGPIQETLREALRQTTLRDLMAEKGTIA